MRSTRIRIRDGREVTLPNADIANNSIVNISSEPERKITVDLGLTYNTSPAAMKKAIALLKEITVQSHNVNEKKTVVMFNSFGEFSLNIRLMYYIKKQSDVFGTMTEINFEVLEKFNQNGIQFAFPTQTIYSEKA